MACASAVNGKMTVDSNDSETRVDKGLGKGDSVIVSPGKDLKDGAKVTNKAEAAK